MFNKQTRGCETYVLVKLNSIRGKKSRVQDSTGKYVSIIDSAGVTYRHLQINRIIAEVDHDWQHGHRRDCDAAGKQEEEDQTADEETQRHGDKHIQLPEIEKQNKENQKNWLCHTVSTHAHFDWFIKHICISWY